MKRYLLGALAVGLTLVGVWACGSSSDNDDLCTEEGGYCTASASCTAVLPFGCGTSGNVCCQNGTSTGPTPVTGEDSGTSTVNTDSGSTPVTTTDSGPTTTTDSGPTTTTDSGPTTTTDAGHDGGTTTTDAGHDASTDAAKD